MKRKKTKDSIQFVQQVIPSEISSIVGIDNSLVSLGFAITQLRDGGLYGTKYFTVGTEPDPSLHQIERYLWTVKHVMKHISEKSLVFMENYAFGAANHRLVNLAGQGEILRMRVWKKTGRHVVMVSIGQIKKFLSGKGNLPKDAVKLKAFQKFNTEFKTTDEAEAYTLVKIGAACLGLQKGLFGYEKDVVIEVRKNLEILQN